MKYLTFPLVRTAYTMALFVLVNLVVSCAPSNAPSSQAEMPELIENEGRYALLVDGKPFFIFGGQSANSSTWPKMLPGVWNTIESMHANTLEVPIYWEQFEPESGKYDYSMIMS